jgi:hypothetical protein
MAGEKRRSPRKHLRYPGEIDIGDGSALRKCLLSDISDTGARVMIEKPDEIPDKVMLLLGHERGARRRCKVVWREDKQIGLEFLKDPAAKAPPRMGRGYKDRR